MRDWLCSLEPYVSLGCMHSLLCKMSIHCWIGKIMWNKAAMATTAVPALIRPSRGVSLELLHATFHSVVKHPTLPYHCLTWGSVDIDVDTQ
jgi:hypothetical protein